MQTDVTNNPVRQALLNRKLTLGTWIQAGHPVVAEIFAGAGFNWIAADMEHTDISVEGFANLARAAGAVPMLSRVRENDTLAIRQVLDAGAMGVIVPLVNSAEEARRAVAAAKYPPQGVRGFAFCRANGWGREFDRYAHQANGDVAVVVMIESKQAVEAIDEILTVDGVDGVFIGPYDMSGSYGVVGQTGHELVRDACATVSEACKRAGKSAGIHVVKPTAEAIGTAIYQGFTFIALGMDTVFLMEGAAAVLSQAKPHERKDQL